MSGPQPVPGSPPTEDRRALVAIDLGAESCRVSLLRWRDGEPEIELLDRIPNGPVQEGDSLRWPLLRILSGIEEGLRKAAAAAPEGIRSIAVDGWAVDYVRLGADGLPVDPPFCYRDERSVATKSKADALLPPGQLFAQTGAQPLRINTMYQLLADESVAAPWVLLPEFVMHWLGGRRVAEYTNATHTGLVDLNSRNWSEDIFAQLGLDLSAAPEIVATGSYLGKLGGALAELPAFKNTSLIAPACHDTASAIAAITVDLQDTAYIVSGTWSLVGTVVEHPIATQASFHAGFTNQGAAGGGYCFHTNINGMWILKQCVDDWRQRGRTIDLPSLVAQAAEITETPGLLDVDAPSLLLAGKMPARINGQLDAFKSKGLDHKPIDDVEGNEPIFARLIFASLAARYAQVLQDLESLTGRRFSQIIVLGGGSRNQLLLRLTAESTGLPVLAGEAEGSTIGNFAVQLASGEAEGRSLSAAQVRSWAERLATTSFAVGGALK